MPSLRKLLLVFLLADAWLWLQLVGIHEGARAYFLNVGQGDGILLQTEGGVQILTDAGKGELALAELERILPRGDRYIDLAVVTHPQEDHFGGFMEIFERYEIGAIIWNGRALVNSPQWDAFFAKASDEAPMIVVRAGDTVRIGRDTIRFLAPDRTLVQSGDPNDSSIVSLAEIAGTRILLTGDSGEATEKKILEKADVLKVGHHGSRFSSSAEFLGRVNPRIAIIQSGVENSYGHPATEALERLQKAGARIFRNDTEGTLELQLQSGRITVFRR